jgi:hypothetical protein
LKDTPSKTLPSKEAYTFSIKDHIHRIINNPMLMPKMYFGPSVEKEKILKYGTGIYEKNFCYLVKQRLQ